MPSRVNTFSSRISPTDPVFDPTLPSFDLDLDFIEIHILTKFHELLLDCAQKVSLSFDLVGCFGLNGPSRHYFSLYRAVSKREGERTRGPKGPEPLT